MSKINYRLSLILNAIEIIEKRMRPIKEPDDFVKDENALTILDSVTIRLQTIGENTSKIEKQNKNFFQQYFQIEPSPIIDFRNIVSHEYELLDYEIIYAICTKIFLC
jgi:uncharacterized protein with HEPN domain